MLIIDKTKLKLIIAKEVLIFFSTFLILALVLAFLYFRNAHFIRTRNSLKEELNSNLSQLSELPTDKIKALYEGVSPFFVIKYQVDKDEYGIPMKNGKPYIYGVPKKEEERFLKDFPTAKSLKEIDNNYSKELIIFHKESIDVSKRSIYDFEFVSLNKFKELIKNEDYKNKFYNIFSDEFELGDKSVFDVKIKEGLSYTDSTEIVRNELTKRISKIKESITNENNNIWTDNELITCINYTALAFLIILYPIRITYIILKWSIQTLRQSDGDKIKNINS
jgi:hypothetical protein